MKKKNTYTIRREKRLRYKYIQQKHSRDILLENSTLLPNGFVNHLNPDLISQSLRSFIKLIRKVKRQSQALSSQIQVKVSKKPVLLYSENKYTRYLLKLAIKKFRSIKLSSVKQKPSSIIEVGGIKQLIGKVKRRTPHALVIFLDNPIQTNIDFCLKNKIYMLSIFSTETLDNLKGSYKMPLFMNTFKRYFWIVVLLESI
jgi:hypothetical protein